MKKEERSRVCPGAKRSLFFALRAGVSSAGAWVVVFAALAVCFMLTACGGSDPDSPPYGEQPVTALTPLPYLNGSDFDMETLKNFETSRGSTLEKTETTGPGLGVKEITYRTTHKTKAKVQYIMADNATYYEVARVIVPQAAFAHRQDVKDELKAAGFVLRKDKTDFWSVGEYDNEKYCISLYVDVDETNNECIFEYNYNYTRFPESPTLSRMPVDEQWVRKVLYLGGGDHSAQLKYSPDVMNWESNSGGRYRNFEDKGYYRIHTFDLAGDNPCMRRYFVPIKGPDATNYPNQCREMHVLYKDLSLGLWKSAYGEYLLNPEMRRLLEQQGFTLIDRGIAYGRYYFRKGDLIICVLHENSEYTNHQPMLLLAFFKNKE